MEEKKQNGSWIIKLFTLGDKFDVNDFWDRVKKSTVEFIILVFGVTVSFGIEQQGGESDSRNDGIENLYNLREEIDKMIDYTDEYIESFEWIATLFDEQYAKWEVENDSIFLAYEIDEEMPEGKYYYPTMSLFVIRNPFNPPRVNFDAIKLDGTFRLLPKEVGLEMTKIYDGIELGYLMENTGKIEERLVNQFKNRIASKWVFDLPEVSIDDNKFWVDNRKYLQKDKYVKYLLFQRLDLYASDVAGQLGDYRAELVQSTKMLDSVIAVRESEFEFIWWVLNPKD
ncbi:MAG: hypothetical protein CNC91_02515 [Flavobacteriales bacterium MED-G22]|nr:hypothetical protein [Flavobacteriaceae bacterium]PDH44319.1 MAG: hypothetical protein CNC91_02515 [Flavobacteriales bacterium MED-G22]|tara:strand:- start:1766 stop:2617 length:852 start_codon:yes stop_codon:yes gene_type:complete